ncbi:MAG: hypothetical protein NVS3B10_28100 [Polyangiales bacterium]
MREGSWRNRLCAALVVAAASCIPVRDHWRPEIVGVVVDGSGTPVAHAKIEVCTGSKWRGTGNLCDAAFTVTADADGAFHVDRRTDWGMISCAGEAPLPQTLLVVCDGANLGGARVGAGEHASGTLRIVVSPAVPLATADPAPINGGLGPGEATPLIRARCGVPAPSTDAGSDADGG